MLTFFLCSFRFFYSAACFSFTRLFFFIRVHKLSIILSSSVGPVWIYKTSARHCWVKPCGDRWWLSCWKPQRYASKRLRFFYATMSRCLHLPVVFVISVFVWSFRFGGIDKFYLKQVLRYIHPVLKKNRTLNIFL